MANTQEQQLAQRHEAERVQLERRQEREETIGQLPKNRRRGLTPRIRKMWIDADMLLAHCELDGDVSDPVYNATLTYRDVLAAAAKKIAEAEQREIAAAKAKADAAKPAAKPAQGKS